MKVRGDDFKVLGDYKAPWLERNLVMALDCLSCVAASHVLLKHRHEGVVIQAARYRVS